MKKKAKNRYPTASSAVSEKQLLKNASSLGSENTKTRFNESTRRRDYFKEIFLFVSSLVCAYFYRWSTTDLIWGFWITSFIVGNVCLVRSGITSLISFAKTGIAAEKVKKFRELPASEKFLFFALALVFIPFYCAQGAFLLLHFSIFHFGHAWILNELYPHPEIVRLLDDVDNVNGFNSGSNYPIPLQIVMILLMYYWLMVIQKLILDGIRQEENSNSNDDDFAFFRPYLQVLRLHILIFVVCGLNAINSNQYLVYVVIYGIFFFPLSIFTPIRSVKNE